MLTLKIFKVYQCDSNIFFKGWQYKGNQHWMHSNMNAPHIYYTHDITKSMLIAPWLHIMSKEINENPS